MLTNARSLHALFLCCLVAWAPQCLRSTAAQYRLMPLVPKAYDENTWFAIEQVLGLSDEQADLFWDSVSTFERDFDAELASSGPGFLIPPPPEGGGPYDAVDTEVANEISSFYDRCKRSRQKIAASAEAVVGRLGDVLSESQLEGVPLATRMARRSVWLGSLNAISRPPGIGRDIEAWIRLRYADLVAGSVSDHQRSLLETMIGEYSVRADTVSRELADLSGETSAAFILLAAGHDARIGGRTRHAADGALHLCDQVVKKGEELFRLNDRLVNNLFSLGIAGFSDELFHDWIDATTPEGIARSQVDAEIARSLAESMPDTRSGDAVVLAERLRSEDIAAVLEMRAVYLECHFEAHRQCARPYGVCDDACTRIAEMQRARLQTAALLFGELVAMAELAGLDGSSSAVLAARRHARALQELAESFDGASDSICTLIGRLGL